MWVLILYETIDKTFDKRSLGGNFPQNKKKEYISDI